MPKTTFNVLLKTPTNLLKSFTDALLVKFDASEINNLELMRLHLATLCEDFLTIFSISGVDATCLVKFSEFDLEFLTMLGKSNPFNVKKVSETEVENEILEYLNSISGYFWKNDTKGTFDPTTKRYRKSRGENGASDILGIRDGVFYAFEVKTPTNKVRPEHQIAYIDRVIANGGVAGFVTSIDEVKLLLNK